MSAPGELAGISTGLSWLCFRGLLGRRGLVVRGGLWGHKAVMMRVIVIFGVGLLVQLGLESVWEMGVLG